MAPPLSFLPPTPRRSFLQRLTAGTAALVVGGWSVASAEPVAPGAPNPDAWLDRVKGKHKAVFDITSANDGFGMAYALNYLDGFKQTHGLTDRELSAVTVYRHFGMPLVLDDATWAKYRIAEIIGVKDQGGAAPAQNIYRANVFGRPGLTYDRAFSERGVVGVACNLALTVISGMAAQKVGVSAEQAKADFTKGLLSGVVLAPSGVYAVVRAQERGCAYVYGG